jgi:S-formylglutathione hydrolase FrmB
MKLVVTPLIFASLFLFNLYDGYSQSITYSDFEPTVFKGSTVVEHVYSPSLEGNLQNNPTTQPVKVYLPPGYDQYPGNVYPVVYLLHGNTQNYNSFYQRYSLANTVNNLISTKAIRPMIIVTPNAKTIYGGSHYTNSYVSGYWEDYIVKDVIRDIEGKYQILDQQDSRGLAGFSMGALGTANIAMKHASLFNSISLIGGGSLDLEERYFVIQEDIENMKKAANINEYRRSDPFGVRACFSHAVAFAPDSTVKPVMGRLPVDRDGVRIDSIWQKWLEHDPKTMLSTYKDSLLKLNAIQIYIGNSDNPLGASESFRQSLLDYGIDHGNEIYSGGHSPTPVLDELLVFFSEQLEGVVPTLRSPSDYYFEKSDTLLAETDMDATLYVIPASVGLDFDSIKQHWLLEADVTANEEMVLNLSDLDFGKYRVFAIGCDSIVGNIPTEFWLVPVKSPPQLSVVNTRIMQTDSIRISMSREGTICLVAANLGFTDTLKTASEIMNSQKLIESAEAWADIEVSFSTNDLLVRTYLIYGFDQYGIVSEPTEVDVVPVGISTNFPHKIMLYPNPFTGTISIETNMQEKFDLSTFSLNGQLIFSKELE